MCTTLFIVVWLVQPVHQNVTEDETEVVKRRQDLVNLAGTDSSPDGSFIFFRDEEFARSYNLASTENDKDTFVIPPHVLPAGLFKIRVFYNVTDQSMLDLHPLWQHIVEGPLKTMHNYNNSL